MLLVRTEPKISARQVNYGSLGREAHSKPPGGNNENPLLLLILVGLAISFALPAFAQQTDTPDPQLREALVPRLKKMTMDSSTAMPLPWPRSTQMTRFSNVERAPIYGREAIQKRYEDDFKKVNYISAIFEQARAVFSSRYRYGWE